MRARCKKPLRVARKAQPQRVGAHPEGAQSGRGGGRVQIAVPYLEREVAVQAFALAVALTRAVGAQDPRDFGPGLVVAPTLDQEFLEQQFVQRRVVGWAVAGEELVGRTA